MLNVHSEEITSLSVLMETVGGWGSRVLNFLVKIQCHVYVAYLTILSILLFHEMLTSNFSLFGVLNRRGGWVGSAV